MKRGCQIALSLVAFSIAKAEPERILAVGGSVTETVFALGAGGQLVGADSSSVYPTEAAKLPQVGYQRQLSAEGILALRPTLIIATTDAGPPEVLEQLRSAGVKLVQVPSEHSVAGAQAKVRAVAAALGRQPQGEKLSSQIATDAEAANRLLATAKSKPKVLFLYARGGATMNVSGSGTAADAMIGLAGAQNAIVEYTGYKPLTSEGAVAAAPDAILLLDQGLASIGGGEKLMQLPGLALTPAGMRHRFVAMDDLYLLGFGPRTGAAIGDLAKALHPELK